ncbi:MAG: hydroxymethylbilane synthase [Chloroflexota bacterium]
MKQKFTVGSRGSRLALIQTRLVLAELAKAYPGFTFELTTVLTKGDRDKKQPTTEMGEGIFVKEIEEALLEGRADLAVHSLKDMPTELPDGLSLAAVTERADARDVLVSNGGKLAALPAGSIIGTGSQRRAAQLLAIRPDLRTQPVRGNVETRLQKVGLEGLSGVILAAAGLLRLGSENLITEYLPFESFLPAVGQGALAIEIREDDKEVAALVSSINHWPTWQSIRAERSFLRVLGGGCHTPIATLGTMSGNMVRLQGVVAAPDGSKVLRDTEEGIIPEEVGQKLAEKILRQGAAQFIK